MSTVLDLISANLGIAFPDLIMLLTLFTCIIFMAKDFRLGLVLLFLSWASEFILFYSFSYNTTNFVWATMVSFVLLVLSFYISQRKTTGGYA